MQVDLKNLPDELCAAAVDVARRVSAAGGRALMVGGSVRDLLCGRHVKDVDIEVFGLAPDDLKRILGEAYELDLVGISFGVLKIKHLDIDISLPRRESKRGLGHKGFDIASDPSLPIPEAASRRDFTVNAIYYDPLADELIDPHGGARDLADGVLRHVSEKFREDPLRVLRGMQFVARFGLDPAPETIAICRTVTPEGLPPERLFEEWAKLLVKGVHIRRGLEFLRETGWVKYYPELDCLSGCEQDPKWHPEGDVWTHTGYALDAFARHRTDDRHEELVVGLAVLCHDFGKPSTTTHDPDGHIRSRGHDTAGVAPTLSFLRRLTNEERILREVPPLVEQHMQPFSLWRAKAGDAAIRRLSLKVGRIDRLLRVAHADDEGRPGALPGGTSGGEDLAWLAAAAERLRVAAAALKPILMGRDLIAMGYKPSPQFGKWLDACFEAQLDGVFSDHAGAIDYFRKIEREGLPPRE